MLFPLPIELEGDVEGEDEQIQLRRELSHEGEEKNRLTSSLIVRVPRRISKHVIAQFVIREKLTLRKENRAMRKTNFQTKTNGSIVSSSINDSWLSIRSIKGHIEKFREESRKLAHIVVSGDHSMHELIRLKKKRNEVFRSI